MMIQKINIGCLNVFLIQIVNGIFESEGLDVEVLDPHIRRFEDRIDTLPEDRPEKFRVELAQALSVILNNPSKISIDDLINDAVGVYMKDEFEARKLLERIWRLTFPNRSYVNPALVFEEVQFVDEGCDSW